LQYTYRCSTGCSRRCKRRRTWSTNR
jgi:hypothetical protein